MIYNVDIINNNPVSVKNNDLVDINNFKENICTIKNSFTSLFLPNENKKIIYKIIEKIKAIFNIKKRIEQVGEIRLLKSSNLLTSDVLNKRIRNIDKITINSDVINKFIAGFHGKHKDIAINDFFKNSVKTKGDLLLLNKVAHFLEKESSKYNELKIINNSNHPKNFHIVFDFLITTSSNNIKKEVFYNIIDDYFYRNKNELENNDKIKDYKFMIENLDLFYMADELNSGFKKIIENMIDEKVDLDRFLKSIESTNLINIREIFENQAGADKTFNSLNKTIEKYLSEYEEEERIALIRHVLDNQSKFNNFLSEHLNKIDDDLSLSLGSEQYSIRIAQIFEIFENHLPKKV